MNSFFFHIIRLLRQNWRWMMRLGAVWWILGTIAPVSHRVLPQPQQTVETTKPHVCVHTDLINEVDEWKIQHTLQLIREMGAGTIVEFFPWAYIESREDHYRWYQADRIIEHARNQGIQVIARLGLVPTWARPENTVLNDLPEESFDDFAEFAADFARRYAGTVNHIVIWNEPNLAFEWGYQPPDAARYVRLLQAVYAPLHAANPEIVVLAGALAPTLEPEGSPNGMDDLVYLRAMLEAGAADYLDALAIHTYGFVEGADADPASDVLNFRRAELLHQILAEYTDKPVYITESGWNDNARWTKAVRPSQRIAYTLDAFQYADTHWPWALDLCIWLFRYTRSTGNYRDNFALVTPEFQLKPIYYALQAYARGWQQEANLWLPAPQS